MSEIDINTNTNINYEELILAAIEEVAAVKSRHMQILAEIGGKILPEIRNNPDFAELIAKLKEAESEAEEIQVRIAKLQEEKERFEQEEKERIARLTCYFCKKVNTENSRFCEECGAKLGEPPREYCQSCGTMNQPNMKFCGECGMKLADLRQN